MTPLNKDQFYTISPNTTLEELLELFKNKRVSMTLLLVINVKEASWSNKSGRYTKETNDRFRC